MPAIALSFSLAIGLAACGQKVENRNIDAVNKLLEQAASSRKDVTTKEVESVLGQPTRVETFTMERPSTKELPGVRYYYKQGDKTIVLHFVDNKLSEHVYHFGDTPPPEESGLRKMAPRPPRAEGATPAPEVSKSTPSPIPN